MTNIVFVHRGGETMASYRYRCQIPGEQLAKTHTVTYNEGDAHICVFSKPHPDDIEVVKSIKKNGCVVVADFGDDHFNLDPTYWEMLSLTDHVICPTLNMQKRLREFTEKDIHIIPDPYEMGLYAPHANGDNLIWFGHQVNLKDMKSYMGLPNLTIVTGPQAVEGTTLWSPENVHRAMLEANISLLPTRPGVEYKSPNRLINSLRMGLFPVCDPHPAYEEFKDFAWTGGVPTGLRWAKHFRSDLSALVLEGQKYIEKYSPENVGKLWLNFIDSI